MKIRIEVLVASLIAAAVTVVAAAGVAAWTVVTPDRMEKPITAHVRVPLPKPFVAAPIERGEVLSGTPGDAPEPARTEVTGIGSNYAGTAGWMGEPTVALPGDLGGRYTGVVNGTVTVCADRCVELPVVDWCQCYWGTADERVVDLSHSAWALVSDQPLSTGLIEVTVILDG